MYDEDEVCFIKCVLQKKIITCLHKIKFTHNLWNKYYENAIRHQVRPKHTVEEK